MPIFIHKLNQQGKQKRQTKLYNKQNHWYSIYESVYRDRDVLFMIIALKNKIKLLSTHCK